MSQRLLPLIFLVGLLLPSAGLHAEEEEDWFGHDKALHYGVSMGLASAGYGSCGLVFENVWLRLAGGACLSTTAGITKELIDLAFGGPFSWHDMAWNAAGIATGLFVVWSIDRLPAVLGDEPPAPEQGEEPSTSPPPPPEPPPPVDQQAEDEIEVEPETDVAPEVDEDPLPVPPMIPAPDDETSPQALAF